MPDRPSSHLPDRLPTAREPSALRTEIGTLLARRWLIAGCIISSMLGALAYNNGVRPIYQSESVISMDVAGASVLKVQSPVADSRRIDALDKQVRALKSEALALLVVSQADAAVLEELDRGAMAEGGWERVKMEVAHRFNWLQPPDPSQARRIQAFRSRLIVGFDPPSPWLTLRFLAYSPEAATRAVNHLVDIYVEQMRKETSGLMGQTKESVEKKVEAHQGKVDEVLGDLATVERSAGLTGVETRQQLLEKQLTTLQDALVEASGVERERRALAAEVRALRDETVLTIPPFRSDAELARTAARIATLEASLSREMASLGERHPEVLAANAELTSQRKLFAQRIAALRSEVARDHQVAVREVAGIRRSLKETESGLTSLRPKVAARKFMEKRVEATEQAASEAIDRSVREPEEALFLEPTVLSEAEGLAPLVSPQKARNFQYALFIGLLSGVLIVWLLRSLDETVKTPEHIPQDLGLTFLGLVPKGRGKAIDVLAGGPETASVTEAYRIVRTGLTTTAPGVNRRVIAITSSSPGEGKSTTSLGIAAALAASGPVLLIDFDLRKASLSKRVFSRHPRGVLDVVAGADLEPLILKSRLPSLDVLPAGAPLPPPGQALTVEMARSLLSQVPERYRWIVCDTPPLLAVSDSVVVSKAADAVVLVVGSGRTPQRAVLASVDRLRVAGVEPLGVVLNMVDLNADSYYYKSYYSYDAYAHELGPDGSSPGPRRRRGKAA